MAAPGSAWITPANMPAAYVRRVLLIPDDPEWEANFRGALLLLAEVDNHEQLTGITAEAAAGVWMEILDTFLGGEICPDP